jgi:hypothetical protein
MRAISTLIFLSLLCTCITARAETNDDPWKDFPIVVASNRINVGVYLVLEPHRVVVSDRNRNLWLLTVKNPRQYPYFHFSEPLVVECTISKDGSVFCTIVPLVGHAWSVPLKSIEAWKPLRI